MPWCVTVRSINSIAYVLPGTLRPTLKVYPIVYPYRTDRQVVALLYHERVARRIVPCGEHGCTASRLPDELESTGAGQRLKGRLRAVEGSATVCVEQADEEFHGSWSGKRKNSFTCSATSLITSPWYSIQECA